MYQKEEPKPNISTLLQTRFFDGNPIQFLKPHCLIIYDVLKKFPHSHIFSLQLEKFNVSIQDFLLIILNSCKFKILASASFLVVTLLNWEESYEIRTVPLCIHKMDREENKFMVIETVWFGPFWLHFLSWIIFCDY